MRRFGMILMSFLGFVPLYLPAADAWPVDEVAVYEGPVNSETSIDQVADPDNRGAFRVLDRDFSAGYSRHPYWFRITFQPPPADPFGQRTLLLVAKPDFTQSLILYRPEGDGFREMVTGALVPFDERPYQHRNLIFPMVFDDEVRVTVYLRLQTYSSSFLDMDLWQPMEHQQAIVGELLLIGIYIGLIFAGMAVVLWHRERFRDRFHQSFLLFLVVMLVHFLGTNGFTVQYLFPDTPQIAWLMVALGSYAVSASLIWLLMHSFSLHHSPVWVYRSFQAVLWAAILMSPAPFLGLHPEATRLLVWLGAFALSIGTIYSLILLWRGEAGGLALLFANLCPLIGALLTSLVLLGALPGSIWLFMAFQTGLLGSLIAFQILIAQRRKGLESAYEESRVLIQQAEQKAAWEQARAEEQQQFTSMLTHELKTPLALIRLRLDAADPSDRLRRYAERAVRDIDAIIDRCAIASRLSEGEPAFALETCSLADIVETVIPILGMSEEVSLEQHIDAKGVWIEADVLLVRTILLNLLDNALKYAQLGSAVVLDASSQQRDERDGVRIQVRNVAGVVGAPDPARVFDKYYRAPGASRFSGSGLGLYIVKRFTVAIGGEIHCEVHSVDQQQEVCFELWLPKSPLNAVHD